MFLFRGVGELESIGTRTVQKVCFFFAGNTKPNRVAGQGMASTELLEMRRTRKMV